MRLDRIIVSFFRLTWTRSATLIPQRVQVRELGSLNELEHETSSPHQTSILVYCLSLSPRTRHRYYVRHSFQIAIQLSIRIDPSHSQFRPLHQLGLRPDDGGVKSTFVRDRAYSIRKKWRLIILLSLACYESPLLFPAFNTLKFLPSSSRSPF